MRWTVAVCSLVVLAACGDDSESEPEPASESESESESASESAPEPAAMVVLLEGGALERRTTANPNEGEPWGADRAPVEGRVVLVGATTGHVLLHEVVADNLGVGGRFHVVPRGDAAREPVEGTTAHLAPDGEHWVVERSYQRFRCGGMKRGRNAFVRSFDGDGERAIGEGFVGFGPEGTVLLSMTTADCGRGGGLRNHRSSLRIGSVAEPEPSNVPGRIGEGGDDPNARLAYHPPPWIGGEPVPVEVEAAVFGPKCFLELVGERVRITGPACHQPDSADFSGDGDEVAVVVHGDEGPELWVIERNGEESCELPLRVEQANGEVSVCGGPRGEHWLVSYGGALILVVGDVVTVLGRGRCLGTTPGGETWAVQRGDEVRLRSAATPGEPGTLLEGVTDLRWLPPE